MSGITLLRRFLRKTVEHLQAADLSRQGSLSDGSGIVPDRPFGLFCQQRDPLSGAFLISLGLPRILWTGGLPEPQLPWIAVLSRVINIVVLLLLCGYIRSDQQDT